MSAREMAIVAMNDSLWEDQAKQALADLNKDGLIVVRAEDARQLAQLNRVEPTIESLEAGIAADLRARANVIAALADQSGGDHE